jgi:hypothetical protein
MFEDLKKEQQNNLSGGDKKVDDIFAETDKTEKSQEGSPTPPSSADGLKTEAPQMSGFDDFDDGGSRAKKILKTLFVIIIILAIIGVGAYFVYSRFMVPATLDTPQEMQEDPYHDDNDFDIIDEDMVSDPGFFDEEEDGVIEDAEETEAIEIDDEDFVPIEESMEALMNMDSDGNGLSDFAEIYIFGTDPFNPDTDGDGFLDGEEIMNCFNPLGEGKIDTSLFVDKDLFIEFFPEVYEECSEFIYE